MIYKIIIFCWLSMNFYNISTDNYKDQQLLLFLHLDQEPLDQTENMNICHQCLTAIVQQATPILMSENIWDYILQRKKTFEKKLHDGNKEAIEIVNVYNKTNFFIQKHMGDISIINSLLNKGWYHKNFPSLANLNESEYNLLAFDFFCYKVKIDNTIWQTYYLPQGYLLWIPKEKNTGFILQNTYPLTKQKLNHITSRVTYDSLTHILHKYIDPNASINWSFFITGHGHHADHKNKQAAIAGMNISEFNNLLLFFNTISTNVLVYSSCYSSGIHAIIPYQSNYKDLLLNYPVITISLTDAPTYTFGYPSGFKLPAYNIENQLEKKDVSNNQLQWHFLQNFSDFCHYAKLKKIDTDLAYSISPYIECSKLNICKATKVENIPLIRKAKDFYFQPLDTNITYSIKNSDTKNIFIDSKSALLWYVNSYPGCITLSHNLPIFVSMIPGNTAHHIYRIDIKNNTLYDFIQSCFLSIEDEQEQNIYFIDYLDCIPNFLQTSDKKTLKNSMIIPTGAWMPNIETSQSKLFLYTQYNTTAMLITFDDKNNPSQIFILNDEQKSIMINFKNVLMQEIKAQEKIQYPQTLSTAHIADKLDLEKELLKECLKQRICKE